MVMSHKFFEDFRHTFNFGAQINLHNCRPKSRGDRRYANPRRKSKYTPQIERKWAGN